MGWRFVLNGEDVTSIGQEQKAGRQHNGPSSGYLKLPTRELVDIVGDTPVGESRLKVYDDANVLWHHGIAWDLVDDGAEEDIYTTVQSYCPMAIWPARPARDADGDYSLPSFFTTQETAPQILHYILSNSVTWEGGMFLALDGTVETGGQSLAAAPVDFPMTIMDVAGMLFDTPLLDVVLEPIDEGGPEIARFHAYNGTHGTDRSGSVVFQYQTGAHNVRRMRRSQSMSMMRNKQFYYLGPKLTVTPSGAAASAAYTQQHWRGTITGDGMAEGVPLPNPPGGDVDYPNPLGDLINDSRSRYWTAMEIRTFDDGGDVAALRPLFARLWQGEQIARVGPRTIVKVTPDRGTPVNFDVGDLVGVQAGPSFRGGFSGAQRVYGIRVDVDQEGVADLGELITSADQEIA